MSQMPSPSGSVRVKALALSAIKGMAMRASAIEDAASLTWGVPSFQTPSSIRNAVDAALAHDYDAGKYTLPDGLPDGIDVGTLAWEIEEIEKEYRWPDDQSTAGRIEIVKSVWEDINHRRQ